MRKACVGCHCDFANVCWSGACNLRGMYALMLLYLVSCHLVVRWWQCWGCWGMVLRSPLVQGNAMSIGCLRPAPNGRDVQDVIVCVACVSAVIRARGLVFALVRVLDGIGLCRFQALRVEGRRNWSAHGVGAGWVAQHGAMWMLRSRYAPIEFWRIRAPAVRFNFSLTAAGLGPGTR